MRLIKLGQLVFLNQVSSVSVYAKFQLSNWSRSDWKDCGWGWVVVSKWLLCLTSTKLLLSWIELRWVFTTLMVFDPNKINLVLLASLDNLRINSPFPNLAQLNPLWITLTTLFYFSLCFHTLLSGATKLANWYSRWHTLEIMKTSFLHIPQT